MAQSAHTPVLLKPMLALMSPKANGVYLDGTFGAGGYSRALLEAAPCAVVAMDRDARVAPYVRTVQARYQDRFRFIAGCFGDMARALAQAGYTRLDGIVLDLGVSSMQLDLAERGFSYMQDGPLDMRMAGQGQRAADIIRLANEQELTDIFRRYGEEPRARQLARALVRARHAKAFTRTKPLADFFAAQLGHKAVKRCFQALRIAVNDELGELHRALQAAPGLLAGGGRLVIVSFHSLEDRMVKQAFARLAGRVARPSRHLPSAPPVQAEFELLTRRVVRPGAGDIAQNSRAASARLRALERKWQVAA